MSQAKKQIWFICTGNTCRSPMAEGLLRLRLGTDTAWEFHSAGLAAMDGFSANETAVQAMRERDYDLTAHRSRAFTRERAEGAHRILVMTHGHYAELALRWPDLAHKVFVLTSFGLDTPPPTSLTPSVPR